MDDLQTLMFRNAELRGVAMEYTRLDIELPESIANELTELNSRIAVTVRGIRQAKLSKLEAQAAALMTAEDKRKLIQEQITALKAML